MERSTRLGVAALIILGVQLSATRLWAPSCNTCNPSSPTTCACGKWEAIPKANWARDVPSDSTTLVQAIHMVQTRTGWVMIWGLGTQIGSGSYVHYWNPNPPHQDWTFSQTPLGQNMFCAGHLVTSQGLVLSIGGNDAVADTSLQPAGIAQTFLLAPPDTITNCTPCSWTAGPVMGLRRWYPTATLLNDGRVVASSGWEFGRHGRLPQPPTAPDPTTGADLAEVPEVYNPLTPGTGWDSLSSAVKVDVSQYPAMYLDPSPNGTRLLYVGPGAQPHDPDGTFPLQDVFRLNLASEGSWSDVTSQDVRGQPTVMYGVQSGKLRILKTGGIKPDYTVTNLARIIAASLTSDSVTVANASSMLYARVQHQLTVLPDGTVLATGGTTSIEGDAPVASGVLKTELWNPSSDSWRELATMNHRTPPTPRMYHSTAVLLPDARVLSAGGQVERDSICPGSTNALCRNADFFSPPYLFNSNGPITLGQRPSINPGAAPKYVAYGEGMRFGANAGQGANDIPRIALIRPGAVTHSRNMDQRYFGFIQANGDFTFSGGIVDVPASRMPSSRLAPPGYYMLFLVNSDTPGRPSVAPFVNLWGIVESSVQVTVTQGCQPYMLTFDVQWDGTVQAEATDSADSVYAYTPGPACSGSPATSRAAQVTAGSFHHRVVVPVSNMCATGTWTLRIRSRKGSGSTASASTFCTSASVACISCQPPPCSPTPCEIEP